MYHLHLPFPLRTEPYLAMDLDYELELQYEHIDWNDIVDAEQSGDQETLELLRYNR